MLNDIKTNNFEEEILVKDSSGQFRTIKVKKVSEKIPPTPPLEKGEKKGDSIPSGPDVLTKEETEEIQTIKPIKVKPPENDFIKLAKEVIQRSAVKMADEILQKRLENLVMMCLRDVRDIFETREMLTRSAETGGLGLDKIAAEKLLGIIRSEIIKIRKVKEPVRQVQPDTREQVKKRVEEISSFSKPQLIKAPSKPPLVAEPPARVQIPPPPPVLPSKPPPKADAPCLSGRQAQAQKPVVPLKPRPSPQPQKISRPAQEIPPIPPLEKGEKKRDLAPLRKRESIPQIKRPVEIEPTKPKMMDVKPPQPIGPVEELKYSLIDFRRLSGDPKEAIGKIQEKVKLLEEESFVQKIEGTKSWRVSEVNRLYLKIGQESMAKGRPVAEVIKERQAAGQPTLTEAEFRAVGELNRNLRF